MTEDPFFGTVIKELSSVVFLSGKTCTGKSTFADSLARDHGYAVVRLDDAVVESVIQNFGIEDRRRVFVEVYRNRDEADWIKAFVGEVRRSIQDAFDIKGKVVVDGALANVETIREVFEPFADWQILYLHPQNMEQYRTNLLSRFMTATHDHGAGLPSRFWSMIDSDDFDRFCLTHQITPGIEASIDRYAKSSEEESRERLLSFKEAFGKVTVANV